MKVTIYREVTSVRRSPRPRSKKRAASAPARSPLGQLLARLTGATDTLAASRRRVRRG